MRLLGPIRGAVASLLILPADSTNPLNFHDSKPPAKTAEAVLEMESTSSLESSFCRVKNTGCHSELNFPVSIR